MNHESTNNQPPPEVTPRGMTDEEFQELLGSKVMNDMYGVAIRILRDPHDAWDAVQDGYERALRYKDNFKGESKPETWMHRITANRALTNLSKKHAHATTENAEIINYIPDNSPTPEELAEIGEEIESLQEVWSKLKKPTIGLLALVAAGVSYKYIAEHRGKDETENAIKIKVHRARKELKKALEKHTNHK